MVTKIIAIDGIHRSGKNTQLTLLQEKIQQLWYEVFTLRWEYYREWNGIDTLTDPYSSWWQEHKHCDSYDLKSQRLQRELYHFFHKKLPLYCKENNIEKSVVLLERSIVWRYLFKHWEKESHENIEQFRYGKNEKYIQNVTIPDIIFVLQPSKSEILQRLTNNKKSTSNDIPRENIRQNYKEQYIPQKYDIYYKGLEVIPQKIKDHIHHIKSDMDIASIHHNIREKAEKILMGNE